MAVGRLVRVGAQFAVVLARLQDAVNELEQLMHDRYQRLLSAQPGLEAVVPSAEDTVPVVDGRPGDLAQDPP